MGKLNESYWGVVRRWGVNEEKKKSGMEKLMGDEKAREMKRWGKE